MHQFASATVGSVDQQVIEHAMREHANEYALSNTRYWMEHELRQYPRVELDLAALAAHTGRIVLAGGCDSQDQLPYQPNRMLAQKLGLDLVNLPGGHLGFLSFPALLAKELMNALSR
jgi:hypothetical protein